MPIWSTQRGAPGKAHTSHAGGNPVSSERLFTQGMGAGGRELNEVIEGGRCESCDE